MRARGVDDKLLVVFSEFIRMRQRRASILRATRDSLSVIAEPLGRGRTVDDLIDALAVLCVLAPLSNAKPLLQRLQLLLRVTPTPAAPFNPKPPVLCPQCGRAMAITALRGKGFTPSALLRA